MQRRLASKLTTPGDSSCALQLVLGRILDITPPQAVLRKVNRSADSSFHRSPGPTRISARTIVLALIWVVVLYGVFVVLGGFKLMGILEDIASSGRSGIASSPAPAGSQVLWRRKHIADIGQVAALRSAKDTQHVKYMLLARMRRGHAAPDSSVVGLLIRPPWPAPVVVLLTSEPTVRS